MCKGVGCARTGRHPQDRKEIDMPVVITVPELAEQMHKSPDKLYEWAKRENDPLPVRYIGGERYGAILVSELAEWFIRNGQLANERSGNAR